jgi:hypothetical protein
MAEHEPLDITSTDADGAEKDAARAKKDDPRFGRREELTPGGLARRSANARSDDAAVASEPMDLQRLPASDTKVPPGRQRTGDPPQPRRPSADRG